MHHADPGVAAHLLRLVLCSQSLVALGDCVGTRRTLKRSIVFFFGDVGSVRRAAGDALLADMKLSVEPTGDAE